MKPPQSPDLRPGPGSGAAGTPRPERWMQMSVCSSDRSPAIRGIDNRLTWKTLRRHTERSRSDPHGRRVQLHLQHLHFLMFPGRCLIDLVLLSLKQEVETADGCKRGHQITALPWQQTSLCWRPHIYCLISRVSAFDSLIISVLQLSSTGSVWARPRGPSSSSGPPAMLSELHLSAPGSTKPKPSPIK